MAAAAMAFGQLDLQLYIDRPPTEAEIRANYTGALHEPRFGALLGAFIDLDSTLSETYLDSTERVRRMPGPFEQKTGKKHASYFFYLGYGRPVPLDWISFLGMQGKLVHVALEPNDGLAAVRDDEYLRQLARDLRMTEAPILLRFASEMNGPWVRYHGNPALYREKFRLVARVMREEAPNVAMVWAPYTTPIGPIPDYYPGDEYVDWVGVNLYSVTYYNQNRRTPGSQVHPADKLDYIYNRFAARKPIMIAEYGATHFSQLENRANPGFARRTIEALYAALPRRYPRVKAIFYFNANNLELEHRQNNNYSVTQHPEVLASYRRAIQSPWFLSTANGRHDAFASNFIAGSIWDQLTVDDLTGPEQGPPPVIGSFPLREGTVLRGTVNLSAWARLHEPGMRLRFTVNGNGLHGAEMPLDWRVTLDTNRLPVGNHTLGVEAFMGQRKLGERKVRIRVER